MWISAAGKRAEHGELKKANMDGAKERERSPK
jgi:hypothetical protein